MKYIPYFLIAAGFGIAIMAAPARTVRFSFSAPHVAPRASEAPAKIIPSLAPREIETPKLAVQTPPKQKIIPTPSSSAPVIVPPAVVLTPVQKTVNDVPIDLRSVVVVKCLFKNLSGREVTAYGSGVIINTEGYVLTARHVVDMLYTYRITGGKQGFADHALDSCRIAVPPDGIKTPTFSEIRTMNPFTPVTEFAYNAQLAFVLPEPAAAGMSDGEYNFADSALLRITSAVTGGLPRAFVASPIKIIELPAQGDLVVSFGFPSGVPSYGSNFYLQGSVGEIKDIVGGDRFFKNQPVGMTAVMETIGGRSGSPVFSHGYVVGVISSKEDYSRNTAISAIFPIARFAEEAGLAVFK